MTENQNAFTLETADCPIICIPKCFSQFVSFWINTSQTPTLQTKCYFKSLSNTACRWHLLTLSATELKTYRLWMTKTSRNKLTRFSKIMKIFLMTLETRYCAITCIQWFSFWRSDIAIYQTKKCKNLADNSLCKTGGQILKHFLLMT